MHCIYSFIHKNVSQKQQKHGDNIQSSSREIGMLSLVLNNMLLAWYLVTIVICFNCLLFAMYRLYVFLIRRFPCITKQHLDGPWISITPSLHKLLSYSWELIELNDERGLRNLDKSGLEGNNKILCMA